jgi:hypothetical protein
MLDPFGAQVSEETVAGWKVPGLWRLEEEDHVDFSRDRQIPGVSQLEELYWNRISKISSDWLLEKTGREIGATIATSHLQIGNAKERAKSALEIALNEKFRELEWICEVPETEIRLEDEVLPIDRSRRMAKNALSYLASHSEDWQRVTTHGPIPTRVVSSIREEDFAIYENRLVRTIIDRSVMILNDLATQLKRDEEASDAIKGSREYYRKSSRVYKSFDVSSELDSSRDLAGRRTEVETLRDSIRSLRQSILGIATNESQPVGELHVTNLLANEKRYREMIQLWEVLRRHQGSGQKVGNSFKEVWTRRQIDLDSYVEVLLAKTLEFLNAREEGVGWWSLSGVDIRVERVNNAWVLLLEHNGVLKKRIHLGIVGVAIGASVDSEESMRSVHALIDQISGQESEDNEFRILLHLVNPSGLSEMMQKLVMTNPFQSAGERGTWFKRRGLILIPVHPLAIDTAERLGRVLGEQIRIVWADSRELSIELPIEFQNVPSEDFDLSNSGFHWRRRELVASSFKFAAPTLLVSNRKNSAKSGNYHDLVVQLKQLVLDLQKKRDVIYQCPVRPYDDDPSLHIVNFWDKNSFELHCLSCGIRWGVRKCASCGVSNPVLNPGSSNDWDLINSDSARTSAQFFGLDLWAEVCEQSDENYVCASCGLCPRNDGTTSCIRCLRD